MTKLSGTVRHLDSGFRRNDGKGRTEKVVIPAKAGIHKAL